MIFVDVSMQFYRNKLQFNERLANVNDIISQKKPNFVERTNTNSTKKKSSNLALTTADNNIHEVSAWFLCQRVQNP